MANISIQSQDFEHHTEYEALRKNPGKNGAVVTFTGLVRDYNTNDDVSGLYIEHYAGMTEKAIDKICQEAYARWALGHIRVIHRIGELHAADQIVFVGVTSAHRKDAFEAAQFLMDYLKQSVPLWKKEYTNNGEDWVDAKDSDTASFQRWFK